MSVETILNQVREFAETGSKLADGFTEYKQEISKAQSQEVCTEAFKEVLDRLDSLAEKNNAGIADMRAKAQVIAATYEGLGFFDKRNSSAVYAMQSTNSLLKTINSEVGSIVSLKPTRQELRQQYNSCQELKGEQDKKEDPEAKKTEDAAAENPQPKEAENQQQDDQTGSSGTTPAEPNTAGQKTETQVGNSTSPGSQTVSEPQVTSLIKPNPLGDYSSYTYNVSLYMVTPEAYNSYLTNNEMPKEGVYIIAQSGGINNEAEARLLTLDGQPGPGKTGLDYFIDDFKINTIYPGKHGQQSSTTATEVTFKVFEPQGFGFLPRLARAAQEVIKKSQKLSKLKKQKPLPFQMLYILAVRFYGYDEAGNIVKSTQSGTGGSIYAGYGSHERFFPLLVSSVRTKLDGRVVTYDWKATVANERFAFGQKVSALRSKASIEASTVGDAIGSLAVLNKKSLLGGLNAEQEELKQKESITYPIKFDVQYEPDSPIAKAKLLDDNEYSMAMAAMSDAQTVQDVTPKLSLKAVTINTTTKMLEIPQGMSIVSVIDQLITKSSFVTESLNKVNNQRVETQSKDRTSVTELTWFAVHPKVEVEEWDEKTNDWSMRITFQIKTYTVPYIRTQYADRKSKYYGPCKLYEYWYTGGNTEVLSYEQTFNSLYYIIQPYSTSVDNTAGEELASTVPIAASSTPNSNDVVGKANGGSKVNEVVRDSVYNVADQYRAQMRIMGDPDFLMETVGGSLDFSRANSSKLFSQFYNKRGSINPYAGQIFCEVVFKISEDYSDTDTGLQQINDQLTFYGNATTQKILGNKGVIYQLIRAESTLRRGQFHQVLTLLIVPPEQLIRKEDRTSQAAAGRPALKADANQSSAEVARLQRQSAQVAAGQINQTAAVAARTGLNLNSQGRVAPGRTAQDVITDTRQNAQELSREQPSEDQEPVSGPSNTGTSRPLATTQVVTPGPNGAPVNNDDASANTGRTATTEPSGREETPPGP